jgi:integrase
MKTRVEHVVALSGPALDFLTQLKAHRAGPYVFFGRDTRGPISRVPVWEMCGRATGGRGSPHGWRASFRSWCADNGVAREVAESALAHTLGGVEAAYNRAGMVERRRPVMEAWAAFLAGESETATVLPFTAQGR